MHPAATRSIRIDDTNKAANDVMKDVFAQYADLIQVRTNRVQAAAPKVAPNMRTGWLIWEDNLTEFLYFEERMMAPNPEKFTAEWNVTPAKGARKASKSLWIYDRDTKQKRYSVTTSAGIKIQPYFDVPLSPSPPHSSCRRCGLMRRRTTANRSRRESRRWRHGEALIDIDACAVTRYNEP